MKFKIVFSQTRLKFKSKFLKIQKDKNLNAEFSRIFRTHHNANTLNSNALNFNAPQSAVLNALRLNLNANTLDFSVNSVVLSNASLNSAANSPLFAHFANGGGGGGVSLAFISLPHFAFLPHFVFYRSFAFHFSLNT